VGVGGQSPKSYPYTEGIVRIQWSNSDSLNH
jgi:hypothetical protein